MLHVVWDAINNLDLCNLLSMAEDGYEFCINDGMISSMSYPMEEAA